MTAAPDKTADRVASQVDDALAGITHALDAMHRGEVPAPMDLVPALVVLMELNQGMQRFSPIRELELFVELEKQLEASGLTRGEVVSAMQQRLRISKSEVYRRRKAAEEAGLLFPKNSRTRSARGKNSR